eukprot:jgi/Mesen1/10618/ME000089S10078
MAQNNWEADKMLDVYIYDYLCKRKLTQSANSFLAEAKVSSDPVAINAPGGFLFEWWSVFWDIFIARTNEKHSDVAASYIETATKVLANKLYEEQLKAQGPNLDESALKQQRSTPGGGLKSRIFQDQHQLNQFNMLSHAQQQQFLRSAQARAAQQQQQLQQQLPGLDAGKLEQLLSNKGLGPEGKIDGTIGVVGSDCVGSPASLQALSSLGRTPPDTDIFLKSLQVQRQQATAHLGSNSGQTSRLVTPPVQQAVSGQVGGGAQASQHTAQQHSPGGDGDSVSRGEQGCIFGSLEPSPSATSTGTPKKGQAGKGNGRKRKQPASSSGPANSNDTAKTGPSPSSNPANPLGAVPGSDVTAMGIVGGLHHTVNMGKHSLVFGDTAAAALNCVNQLSEVERFGDESSLDDGNVESFLSTDDGDAREPLFGSKRNPVGPNMDSKGFSFTEMTTLLASINKVVCCHFSPDGKILATAGHDKRVVLWNMDTMKIRGSPLEEHSLLITDVRFSPTSTRLATSSFDKTVRVWDADAAAQQQGQGLLRTFAGHQTSVMSLDFHPTNEDFLASCDGDSEIRYWSVNQGLCTRVFKGATTQIRFQPRTGRLLAAAAENVVSIIDVDSETPVHYLQRHTKPVHSVCWDATGDYVASVSEDSVRVWSLGPGSDGECVHELNSSGNKFHSCIFHPKYPSLLVIGCYQSLELWNMVENKSMTVQAHDGLIAALAQSPATGLVASASHDKCVKLWS